MNSGRHLQETPSPILPAMDSKSNYGVAKKTLPLCFALSLPMLTCVSNTWETVLWVQLARRKKLVKVDSTGYQTIFVAVCDCSFAGVVSQT